MVTSHLKNRRVTVEMLSKLPAPVQCYMNYTGVLGQPWIETVRVRYAGRFRLGADKPWMRLSVEQFYTTEPAAFLWKARFKMAGLPLMNAVDRFKDGHGHMLGKVAGLFTVVDGRGPEVDQGSMVRYMQEATWFPIAYLGERFSWQPVNDHCADLTFCDCGKTVSARVYFDDVGRMVNFEAQRYGEFGGTFQMRTWTVPTTVYAPMAGLRLPTEGVGVWLLPEGDLSYIDVHTTMVEYNQPIPDI